MDKENFKIHELRLKYLDVLSKYDIDVKEALRVFDDIMELPNYKQIAQQKIIQDMVFGENEISSESMDVEALGKIMKNSLENMKVTDETKLKYQIDGPFENVEKGEMVFSDSKDSVAGGLTPDERTEKISSHLKTIIKSTGSEMDDSKNVHQEVKNDDPSKEMVDPTKKAEGPLEDDPNNKPLQQSQRKNDIEESTIKTNQPKENIPVRYEDRIKYFQQQQGNPNV